MTNKYRGLRPLDPGPSSLRETRMGMNGGLRTDIEPFLVRPDQSPDLSDVRFERRAVRKDFGWTEIGTPASLRVLGLAEHKFIDSNLTFHRIVRITRVGGNAVLEVWDGSTWVLTDSSTETILDAYLSMISAQGGLYMAEGTQILEWIETPALTTQEDDFPSLNSLTALNDETSATISPADTIALDYDVNYDVEITDSPDEDVTVTLEFYHDAVLLGSKQYMGLTTSTYPLTFDNEIFEFNRKIDNNDTVKIKLAAISGGIGEELDAVATAVGGTPELEGNKTPQTQEAFDDKYTFEFNVTVSEGCTVTIGFYTNDGSWVQQATEQYSLSGSYTKEITVDGLDHAAAKFGIHRESISGGGCALPGDASVSNVNVRWKRLTATFDIHGHNKAVDTDAPAGVVYVTEGAPVSQFAVVHASAPAAKYIVHFARRLVALQDGGDSQVLTWSVDGNFADWTSSGSGSSTLVEARGDPIDPLVSAAVLNSNFLAVFRSRSIWRVFETGVTALALGAVSWIENLGTDSPFSVQNVLGGVIFLGHDLQVYFLTEDGPRAIGDPIHQLLVETLTSNKHLVDSGYDTIFGEYFLGVPEAGAAAINKVYIFDVGRFIQSNEIIWRRRPMNVERFAVASEVE